MYQKKKNCAKIVLYKYPINYWAHVSPKTDNPSNHIHVIFKKSTGNKSICKLPYLLQFYHKNLLSWKKKRKDKKAIKDNTYIISIVQLIK